MRGEEGEGPARTPGRRTTGPWRVRRRYKVAQWLLAAAGLVAVATLVAASVAALPDPLTALERGFLAQSAIMAVAAVAVPWVVLGTLGRRAWQRSL